MTLIIRLAESMTGFANQIRNIAHGEHANRYKECLAIALQAILFGAIIAICLADLDQKNIIFVTTDEFGYWANASFFDGMDWSGVSSNIPYYAYGYSIWLAPLLKICSNSIIAYKAALVFNAIFLGIGFLILVRIEKTLFPKINTLLALVMSFCVTLYSGNVYLSQFSFTECLLWMLMIIFTYCLIKAFRSHKTRYYIILCFLSAYMFMVHMRTVGIIIAWMLVLLMYCMSKKKEWHKLLFSIVIIVILCGLSLLLKNTVVDFLYSGESAKNTNDISGQAGKLVGLFSWRGMINLGENVLGEIFYLGAATFYLFYFGALFLFKKSIEFIRSFLGKTNPMNVNCLICVFLLLSILGNIAIGSLSLEGRTRIDLMIYGRYNEYVLSVILLLGIIELVRNRKRLLWFILFLAFHVAITLLYHHVYRGERSEPVRMAISGLLGWIFTPDKKLAANFEFLVCYKSSVIALGFTILACVKLKQVKKFIPYAISAACTVGWLLMEQRACTVTPITSTIKYMDAVAMLENAWDKNNVYYVTSQSDRDDWYNNTAINYMQFMIPDCTIQSMDYSEIDMLQDTDIVILKDTTQIPEAVEDRYAVIWTSGFQILAEKGSVNEAIMANNRNRFLNEKFVQRLYSKVLNRQGETADVEDWTNRINTGSMTAEEVARSFFMSEEFNNRQLSDEDYVEILYQIFMNRKSDAAGKADWISILKSGATREQVLEGFSQSEEFRKTMGDYGK